MQYVAEVQFGSALLLIQHDGHPLNLQDHRLVLRLAWWRSARLQHALSVSIACDIAYLNDLEPFPGLTLSVCDGKVRQQRWVAYYTGQSIAVHVRNPFVLCGVGVSCTGVASVNCC